MGKIKITSDSTCDLADEVLEQYDIDIIPLYINLGDESYKDMVEVIPEHIYAHADKTGELPKTSAIPVADYIHLFKKFQETHDAIIHINLGQDFSSCHQNARLAAEEFENVYVVDSSNLSTGMGALVLEAAIMADNGENPQDIIEKLSKLKEKVETSFVIDTLDYLKMGGRCTSVEAIGASLLNIKPSIEVIDGKMQVGKKYRGKLEKTLLKFVADRLKDRQDISSQRVYLTHSGCSEETIEKVKNNIKEFQNFDDIVISKASCTISSHCGPNTLGIMYMKN